MLSKKNIQGRLRKVEPTEQRFSIRKFTVGAASVLIGMAFMGMSSGQTAHAATTEQNPVVETNKTDSSSTAEKLATAKADAVKSAATDQTEKSAETEKATSNSSANESEAASNNINSTASQNNVVKSDNNTAAGQSKATETKALTTKAKSDAATPVEKATQNQNGGVASSAASTNSAAPASTAKVSSASADSTAKASAKKSVVPTGDEAAKLAEKYGKKIVATDTSSTKDTTEYKNSEDASDWESFINALNNANTDHINITQDITVTGKATGTTVSQKVLYGGRQALSGKDIARTVTISGNDHTIDFTNQALDLTDANQGDNNDAWNITLENVTIKADELKAAKSQTDYASYSPISLTKVSAKNQAKDTITFKNVTADVTGRPVITGMTTNSAGAANTGYEKYTLVLEGNNNLTSTAYTGGLTPGDDGDAISAGYIIVKNGTTTINMPQTTKYNLQYGGAAVRANADFEQDETTGEFTKYPVDVQEGATLNITGGDNVKGIVAIGTDEQLRGGAVNIDGNVNMNMGSGHSIAVYSGNLVVGKTGNLDVTTAMSSNTGTLGSIANYNSPGWGVLSIGVGKAGSAAIDNTSSVLEDNGVIKVVRTSTDKGYNPMISMGSGASSGNNTKTININEGATLDLQDNTQQTNEGMIFINGWVGGAAGSGLKGYINFNSPEYVNLQRLNPNLPSNGGAFIYNERQNQNTAITSSPVAQWDAANLTDTPNYTWMITSSSSRGRMGSNADGFAPIGFDSSKVIVPDAASSYLTSNGSVIMAPTQGDGQYDGSQKASANTDQGRIIGNQYPYLNQFLNNFSWWTPQRIAMGTKLLETDSPVKSKDNDLYEPEVQTIDGTTNQTLSDLNPQDGIKDILKTTVTKGDNGENELSSAVDSDVKYTIAWYNPTDDATEWKDVMGDKAAPENPTGNLKTTDKSAWAKITYSDGTVDFANIPLNITEPDTTVYQPEYKDSKGTQGKDVEIPVNYPSDANDKSINPNNKAPEGTKYALGKDAPTGATIDPSTGTITYDIPADQPVGDVSIPVTVSYPDGTSDSVTAKVTVDPSDKNEYQPSYKPVDVKKGGSVTTGAPTYTNTDGKDVTAPEGTKYSIPEGTKLPEGVKASVGSDGKVTVQTSDNTPEGPIEVPVTVTYPDGSTDTVNAPIIVGGTTFVGTDYTVTSYLDLNNIHETTANSMYPDAKKSVLKKVVYWNNNDLAQGNTDGHQVSLDDVTVTWTNPINTVVKNASMSATLPGTGTATVSDSNPAVLIKFGPNSQLIKDTGNNLYSTSGGQMTAQWYGGAVTMEGAAPVADAASKKAVVAPAKAGDALTAAELALIDTANLGKLTANKPVSYTWANDLKAGDTQGTVKITFSDTDKDGNPTYLNVELPAGSLAVKDDADKYTPEGQDVNTTVGKEPSAVEGISNTKDMPEGTKYTWKATPDTSTAGTKDATVVVTYPDKSTDEVPVKVIVTDNTKPSTKTDADKYTPEGQDVHTTVGGQPEASEGISNKSDMPEGTKYTWKTTPDTSTVGTKDATVVVTYPDKSTDEVPVHVIVSEPSSHTTENAEGTPIVTEKGNMPDPSEGIKNKSDLPDGTKYTWKNGDPDVSKVGESPVTITVHYPDGKTQDVDTKIIVTGTEKPGDPGITDPKDPAYSDLFKTVTRTIVTETPNSDGTTTKSESVQKVVFGRTKAVTNDNGTAKTTYSDYTIYNTDTNTLTNDKTGTFTKVTVPQHDGYVSEVNGAQSKEVPAEAVTAETPSSTVTITYAKADSDAAKYDPEGQDINTNKGVTPDPEDGIKNKSDLPEGTKYTWTNPDQVKDDVDKPGSHSETIKVTYPDGSTDEVPVKVIVTNPSTDADKYSPEGQPVTTSKGEVPDAKKGIKNTGDMPEGTKYDWTDPDQVKKDVDTTGDHTESITVTYPDGSTTTVKVPVTVKENATDADKNTPEVQPIDTPQGTVPNPSDGIKNKDDMPDGTKYTWTDPDKVKDDVKKPGTHDETVNVTYPDGSKDPVTVKVVVSPEVQPITTDKGEVPDPNKAIKNPEDLPDGTKVEWNDPDQVKKDVDTTGDHTETIKVTYPDGSTTTVKVPVTVVNPDNGGNSGNVTTDPAPIAQDIHTTVGTVPAASEGISNTGDMPAGTTYTWKETPDVSTEGTHTGVISVNYPDGSSVDVPVTVIVGSNNTNTGDGNKDTKPEPQPITTDQGKLPDPSDGIKNKDDMPNGTTYTWKKTPDVSKTGTHKVTIVVTYPDGKTAEVTTTITVVKAGSEAGTTTGNGSGNNGNGSTNMNGNNGSGNNSGVATETGAVAGTNSTEANSANGNGTAKAATNNSEEGKLPQTGASDSSKTGIFGLALAAIAGLFGIAGDRKRKNN